MSKPYKITADDVIEITETEVEELNRKNDIDEDTSFIIVYAKNDHHAGRIADELGIYYFD